MPSSFKLPSLAGAGCSGVISCLAFIVERAYMCVFKMEIIDQVRFRRRNRSPSLCSLKLRAAAQSIREMGAAVYQPYYSYKIICAATLSREISRAAPRKHSLHSRVEKPHTPDKLFFSSHMRVRRER